VVCAYLIHPSSLRQVASRWAGRALPEELEFVGVGVSVMTDNRGGWHQPDTAPYELDSILSAEDTAMLAALMDVGDPGQERMRFLGG
jgi:hypothetical protein